MANRLVRRGFKTALWLAAVLCAAAIGIHAALESGPVQKVVLSLVTRTIENNTKAKCSIDRIGGSLITGVRLEGLILSDPDSGSPVVSAKRLDIRYSVPLLLSRVLWINRMRAEGVSIHLKQAADKRWRLPAPIFAPQGRNPGSSPYRIIIRRFDIGDSNLLISGGPDASEILHRFKSINGRASLRIGRSISVRIARLNFQLDHPHLMVSQFSGEIDYSTKSGRLKIRHGHLKTGASEMSGDFQINPAAKNFGVDLSLDVTALSLSELEMLLPRPLPADFCTLGVVSGKIQLKGPLSGLNHRIQVNLGKSLIQSAGRLDLDPAGGFGADLHAEIRRLDSAWLPFLAQKPCSARLNADLSLNLQHIQTSSAKGEITAMVFDTKIAGREINSLKMQADLSGKDLSVKSCTLDTPYGCLEGSGELAGILSPSSEKRLQLALDLTHVDLESVFEAVDVKSDLNLSLEAGLLLPADFNPAQFDPAGLSAWIFCKGAPSEVAGIALDHEELEASLEKGRVEIKKLVISGKSGNARCEGEVFLPNGTCRLSAKADIQDINSWQRLIPDGVRGKEISGSVSAAAEIKGFWQHPHIHAILSGGPVAASGICAGGLDLHGEWSGSFSDYHLSGVCGIENLRMGGITIPKMDIAASGSQEATDLEVSLSRESGRTLDVAGRLMGAADPVKKLLISRIALSSPGLPDWVNQGPVAVVLSQKRLEISPMVLAGGDALVKLSGSLVRTPISPIAAHMAFDGVDLSRIRSMLGMNQELRGTVSGDIRLSGSAANPEIRLHMAATDPGYADLSFTEMALKISYQNARAIFEMNADRGGKQLVNVHGGAEAKVSLDPFTLSPDYDSLELVLAIQGIDIGELASLWPAAASCRGRLSATARLTGAGDTMRLAAKVAAANIVCEGLSISDVSASFLYRNGSARITASGFQDKTKVVDISGTTKIRLSLVPFMAESRGDGLDMNIHLAGIDISPISKQLNHPEYDAGGRITLSAKMAGDVMHPRITGELRLDDGFLVLKKMGLSYEKLSADVAFDQDELEIRRIHISGDREGDLSLSGTVAAPGFHPGKMDIHATGKEFYLPFYAGIDAWGDPDLKLTGTPASPVLTGTILVKKGQINTETLFGNAPSEIQVIKSNKNDNGIFTVSDENSAALSAAGPLRVNVALNIPKNVWVKGKEESIEIQGSVDLKKEPGAYIVLYGPLQAIRGTYRFRSRLFKITSGDLQFIGQEDINPPVDIEAETRIEDVRIIIHLTGTFDRMNMQLDSIPAMSRTDIISYLIFGQPTDSLSEGESFRAGEAALGMTGQFAADELREVLGEKLSFDYIGVSPGSEGFRDGSVSMGKYLTPKVYIIYRYGFSEEKPQQVEVNYEINRNFSLETEVDNERTSAVDLIWKYDF